MTKDRLLAALACSAVGDALGDAFEFESQIDPKAVRQAIQANSPLEITDDSQMAYFTMRALQRYLENPQADFAVLIQQEYIAWHTTQVSMKPAQGIPAALYKVQAPGITCMNSCKELSAWGTRLPNQSRGCGSVMRILPFAFGLVPDTQALRMAVQSAAVTHDHLDNVRAVVQYMEFAKVCREKGFAGAYKAVPNRIIHKKKIDELGAGFYATEAIDMAMWAVYHANSLEDLLVLSIAHDGDSDSVAAIAGGLYGLLSKEWPTPWLLQRVTEWKVLALQAKRLYKAYEQRIDKQRS
jgi:ADP-ribosyl-[dinitrogen reductase] hydrolase